MQTTLKVALASTLALATAAPAYAQYSGPYYGNYNNNSSPYRPTDQYQQDQQRYEEQRDAYEAQQNAYQDRREDYRRAREEYDRRLMAYNRARADYDARYGYGAYARIYGPAPVWDETHWAYYVQPATPYYAPSAPYYGADTAYVAPAPAHCDNSTTVGAGVIGAIAGAVLGSNVAARNARTEGAVLGGLVGAGIGAAVGHAHDKYKCDQRGPYFTYNETIPYREGGYYHSDRYSEYQRMGCRLAPAPVNSDASDYRYVRVCPDPDGRYRIVG
jgi:hypothetical protein